MLITLTTTNATVHIGLARALKAFQTSSTLGVLIAVALALLTRFDTGAFTNMHKSPSTIKAVVMGGYVTHAANLASKNLLRRFVALKALQCASTILIVVAVSLTFLAFPCRCTACPTKVHKLSWREAIV